MSRISCLLNEVKIYNLCNFCDFYEHVEGANGCRSDGCNCKYEIEKQIVSEIRVDAIDKLKGLIIDTPSKMVINGQDYFSVHELASMLRQLKGEQNE